MFVTPFNVLDFTDGMFDRPYYWVTADIDTGKLICVYQCYSEPTEEFCHSVYERRYDLHLVSDKPINRKYFDNAFSMLDEVRSKIVELKRITSACPLPYRKFFRSLSI